eukprot:148440-Amphidinium_carterae.1
MRQSPQHQALSPMQPSASSVDLRHVELLLPQRNRQLKRTLPPIQTKSQCNEAPSPKQNHKPTKRPKLGKKENT